MDVKFTHADCLRSQTNFGETIVHNICTGEQHMIPWGGADWALAGGLSLLLAVGVVTLIGVASMMLRDFFRFY